jgi:hypothetical protein
MCLGWGRQDIRSIHTMVRYASLRHSLFTNTDGYISQMWQLTLNLQRDTGPKCKEIKISLSSYSARSSLFLPIKYTHLTSFESAMCLHFVRGQQLKLTPVANTAPLYVLLNLTTSHNQQTQTGKGRPPYFTHQSAEALLNPSLRCTMKLKSQLIFCGPGFNYDPTPTHRPTIQPKNYVQRPERAYVPVPASYRIAGLNNRHLKL